MRCLKKAWNKLEKILQQHPDSWYATATRISEETPNTTNEYERRITNRILELADGKPVYTLIEIMREEESKQKGKEYLYYPSRWTDIWKNGVAKRIENMSKEGYISIKPR